MEQVRPHIPEHCRALGIVGENLVSALDAQLTGQLLQACSAATQPLLVTGPTGSGRTLIAKLCHQVSGAAWGRRGEMLSIDCSGSETMLASAAPRQGLLALAGNGTLVLDGVERLSPAGQTALATLLQGGAVPAAAGESAPLFVLIGGGTGPPRQLVSPLAELLPQPIELPPLFARGVEIQQLAAHFLQELAREACPGRNLQLTRRALSDLRQSVELREIASVGRLREVVRSAVLPLLERGELPDRIPSELLAPVLDGRPTTPAELAARQAQRDLAELEDGLPEQVDRSLLLELARRHHVPEKTLESFCRIMETLLSGEEADGRLSYPQVVERARIISRVALWLVSGARGQSDFRKFFGKEAWRMPTKSVAWAIFHDVIGGSDVPPAQGEPR